MATVWIISLDLSKAFDKVNWETLWAALMQHGVSKHLVWILQCIYSGQSGKVRWCETRVRAQSQVILCSL